MTLDSLMNELWHQTLTRLGGEGRIAALARETRAFLRPRQIKCAADLLRITLAYCLGGMGLRSTSAWAASVGLADLSNVALLGRLQNSTAWMQRLVEELLAANSARTHALARGRPVRLLDGTLVPKASVKSRQTGEFWRIHAVFDLPLQSRVTLQPLRTDRRKRSRASRTRIFSGRRDPHC